MNFLEVDSQALAGNLSLLELFFQEYTRVFDEVVNPSCGNCVNSYLDKYKNHLRKMANDCKFKLHAKYEGIPLEFGSDILVTNANITEEYAKKLLKHVNGERYFEAIPKDYKAEKVSEVVEEDAETETSESAEVDAPKKRGRKPSN